MATRTRTLLPTLLIGTGLIVSCAADPSPTLEEDHGERITVSPQALCTTPEPNCTDVVSMSDDGRNENGQFTASGGCVAYEDANFSGDTQSLDLGWVFTFVGDSFNDEISSFRIAPGCEIAAWENSDKGGEATSFLSDTPFVGSRWNDRISAWACRCQ